MTGRARSQPAILENAERSPPRGFGELALMSTTPVLPLYLSFGFRPIEDVDIPLPDGLSVAGVAMRKPIDT
jgi:hypothetical protein